MREEFPKGLQRKKLDQLRVREIAGQKHIENNCVLHYAWKDSPADSIDGSHCGYNESFARLLPENNKNLSKFIMTKLENSSSPRLGVDVGGVGRAFFANFPDNFFAKTVGYSLTDFTDPAINGGEQIYSSKVLQNHSIITGDAYSPDFIVALDKWRCGQKISLFVSRMGRGLDYAPKSPFAAFENTIACYERMAVPGVMIMQVPNQYMYAVDMWVKAINRQRHDGLVINFAKPDTGSLADKKNYRSNPGYLSTLLILKQHGAPDALPEIEIDKIYRAGMFVNKKTSNT